MVFGTSQHLTSPHCTSPHPPAPHHTPCTWASGAPENLAKAMTLMHSGWMEGSPQSGDQLSSSIPPPPHQHFPHLLTPPWWSSLTLPPPSTHFATNSTTSDTSLSLSACASPTSAKIGQHPCPPVLKNSLYSANYIFEACPTTAKVLVLCLHLPASSLPPSTPEHQQTGARPPPRPHRPRLPWTLRRPALATPYYSAREPPALQPLLLSTSNPSLRVLGSWPSVTQELRKARISLTTTSGRSHMTRWPEPPTTASRTTPGTSSR